MRPLSLHCSTQRVWLLATLCLVALLSSASAFSADGDAAAGASTEAQDKKQEDPALTRTEAAVDRLSEKIVPQETVSSKADSVAKVNGGHDAREIMNRYIQELQKQQANNVNHKYQIGHLALEQMQAATSIIKLMGELVDVEGAVNLSTSVWADKKLRNGWDEVTSWGTTVGLAVAALSPAFKGDRRDGTVAIGLGLGASVQLLGRVLGTHNSGDLKERVQFIEFSRQAYDALAIRQLAARQFVERAEEFDKRLKAFGVDYSKADATQDKSRNIALLKNLIGEFQSILGLVPGYLDSFRSLEALYFLKIKEEQIQSGDMKAIRKMVLDAVGKSKVVSKRYNDEVRPVLDVAPRIKAALDA